MFGKRTEVRETSLKPHGNDREGDFWRLEQFVVTTAALHGISYHGDVVVDVIAIHNNPDVEKWIWGIRYGIGTYLYPDTPDNQDLVCLYANEVYILTPEIREAFHTKTYTMPERIK